MVEIKIESINKEDLSLDEILSEISKEMSKKMRINKEQMKSTKTPKETPSLEKMKKELEMYKEMANTLTKQIKEEEQRRKKNENHLIEKKVRTITQEDKMIYRSKLKSFKSVPKKMLEEEIYTYERKGNKVICKIKTSVGTFIGEAMQHPEDNFDYESGMMLARVRAKKKMYENAEKILISVL